MKLPLKVCKKLLPGKSITKISHLGSGKMGNVYKVSFDKEESICIKVLTKNHYTRSQDSDGWKCAYEHFDFKFRCYEDTKYFYFTTPFFEGHPFHYAIQYNLISKFQIIRNLIKAITDIHRKGIIHRDLTCNNIIIDKNTNKVNIIDFGRSVNAFNLHSFSSVKDYIHNLQLPGQSSTTSNIRRIFQPYTAPEHFRKYRNNNLTIGFRSDYYSIAQLFKLLIPEYSYLANKILITEGIDRNAAFSEFCEQIDDILIKNQNNPKFYQYKNNYSNIYILYKRIIFFIKEIFYRLFNLSFQPCDPTFKKTTEQNNPQYVGPVFFKLDKSSTTLNMSLTRNTTLYKQLAQRPG